MPQKPLEKPQNAAENILDSLGDALITTDLQGMITRMNPVAETLTGYRAAEVLGVPVITLLWIFNQLTRQSENDFIGKVLSAGTLSWRGSVVKPSGNDPDDCRFAGSAAQVHDETGKISGVAVVFHEMIFDKADRKEEQGGEKRYRGLFENLNVGVAVYQIVNGGEDFIFRDLNHAGERIDHDRKERLIGKSIFEVRPGIEEFGLIDVMRRVWRTGKPEFFPATQYKDNRLEAWYENFIYRISSDEIVAVFENITERKQSEQALIDSLERERFFGNIIRDASVAVGVGYPDGRLGMCNLAFQKMTGYSEEELKVTPWNTVLTPAEWLKDELRLLSELEQKKQPVTYEKEYLHKSGKRIPVELVVHPYFDPDGEVLHYYAFVTDISARKKAEKELREHEEKLRLLIDHTSAAIAMFDLDMRYIIASRRWISDFHIMESDLVGKSHYEVFPEISGELKMVHRRGLKGETIKNEGERFDRLDGSVQWLRWEMRPWYKADNSIGGIVIFSEDITERKNAEERLRESEEQYRGLMESLDSVVAMVDKSGTIQYMNEIAATTLGGSTHDYIGRKMDEVFPAEFADNQLKIIQKVIRHDRPVVREIQICIRGRLRWYRSSYQPLHEEMGRVVHVLVNVTDIDDIKRIHQELSELNRTLEERIGLATAEIRDLYDNAPSGYHSLDAGGNFVMINQTELGWLGYSSAEILGRPLTDFLTPASQKTFENSFPAFKEQGWVNDLEFEMIRRDGTLFPVLISATAIKDDKGNYLMSRSTVVDITEHKRAEEALRLANAELERAMRIKDEFLANMSHELRTPLNAILGFSESMIRQFLGTLNEQQVHAMKTIDKSGRHLLELINDILDISKIEAKQMTLDFSKVIVADICEASLIFVRQSAQKKNIRLESRIDPEVRIIRSDGLRLRQMLINLLNNAVKFTLEGGMIELNVSGNSTDKTVSFSVIDTGIGITPENLERLFQPFVQLESGLTRRFEGTGLGLALVERLARLHGGSISVQSEPGRGSRFTIIIPWKEQALSDPYHPVSDENLPGNLVMVNTDESSPLILIAEDNDDNLAMLTTFLHSTGYRIATARNGLEALDQARLLHPALILMDLQMPGMDGLESIRRLRKDEDPGTAAIPVIALTALAMTGDRERSLEAGADEYLSKPVSLDEMAGTIDRLIRKK